MADPQNRVLISLRKERKAATQAVTMDPDDTVLSE